MHTPHYVSCPVITKPSVFDALLDSAVQLWGTPRSVPEILMLYLINSLLWFV